MSKAILLAAAALAVSAFLVNAQPAIAQSPPGHPVYVRNIGSVPITGIYFSKNGQNWAHLDRYVLPGSREGWEMQRGRCNLFVRVQFADGRVQQTVADICATPVLDFGR